MKYHELKATSTNNKKRVGRGISAGGGKTAGRGTKGQNSRTGGGTRLGFEGGQNPLMQRVPKLPGFTSRRKASLTVTLSDIERVKGATVDNATLHSIHVVEKIDTPVRVVSSGELKSKKTVKLQAASANAVKAIEKAGGSFSVVAAPKARTKQPTKK